MTVPRIIQDFIPAGRRNRPGKKLVGPPMITVHDTGNPSQSANAEMHGKYLRGEEAASRPVSWHFTADAAEIRQHLDLDEQGIHAGTDAGNASSIGIEICENADGDRAKAEKNAAWLVARLRRLADRPQAAVVQHNYWSGKNCPRIIRARPGGWEAFLTSVQGFWVGMGSPVRIELPTGAVVEGELRDGTTWIMIDGIWCRLRAWAEVLGLVVDWRPGTPPTVVVRYPGIWSRFLAGMR